MIYLATAAVGRIPEASGMRMSEYLKICTFHGQHGKFFASAELQLLQGLATLTGRSDLSFGFVANTTAGLSTVVDGSRWNVGDEVIVDSCDFETSRAAWSKLRDRGVRVIELALGDAPDPYRILSEHVTPRLRVVSLSTVNWLSGRVLRDLGAICDLVHDVGGLVVADVIQSLGCIALDLSTVDVVTADGHKWLLGPKGAAFVGLSPRALDRLTPAIWGWRNHAALKRCPGSLESARATEFGSLNELGLVGLSSSVQLLNDMSMVEVDRLVRKARNGLVEGLQATDCELLGEPWSTEWGGIVSFRERDVDPRSTHERLASAGIIASFRFAAGSARGWVRLSPHYDLTRSEVDDVIGVIAAHG